MSPRTAVVCACVAAVAGSLAAVPAAAEGRTFQLVSVGAATLDRAREGAARKLEQPQCRALLDEFKDASGQPLAASLARFQISPAEYLRMIPFLDGSSRPLCRSGRADMFSVTGVPRVFVCRSFADVQLRKPWTAESIVIHEMLHTLGLGESPPSSDEITRRVSSSCQ